MEILQGVGYCRWLQIRGFDFLRDHCREVEKVDQQLSLDKLVGCQRICLGELGLDFQPSFVVVVCPYGCDGGGG